MKRALLFVLPATVLGAAFWYGSFSHQVPAGQPALAAMDLDALRAEFNRAADRARLIVLLSPT